MIIRLATMDDAPVLFAWRNDPATRANSITTDPVAWDGHCGWLEMSLASPIRQILVAEIEGVPVGTVRVDKGEETELSWTVAPDQRGKGVGTYMLAMASPSGSAVAKIKPANVASQKIAERAGFKLVGVDNGLQIWRRP